MPSLKRIQKTILLCAEGRDLCIDDESTARAKAVVLNVIGSQLNLGNGTRFMLQRFSLNSINSLQLMGSISAFSFLEYLPIFRNKTTKRNQVCLLYPIKLSGCQVFLALLFLFYLKFYFNFLCHQRNCLSRKQERLSASVANQKKKNLVPWYYTLNFFPICFVLKRPVFYMHQNIFAVILKLKIYTYN